MEKSNTLSLQSSIHGNIFALLATLSCSLLVIGFSILVVFKLILIAVAATAIGAPLWSIRNRRAPVCTAELLGVGCAIGFAVIGVFGLFLRGPALVLSLLAFGAAGISRTRMDGRWNSTMMVPLRNQDLLALGTTPLIATIPFHPKIALFILPATALILIRRSRLWLLSLRNHGLSLLIGFGGFSALVVYDILGVSRPWRDLIELDLLSDEATAFGIHANGLSESFTIIGEPFRVHFLALASHGTAARLFEMPAFVLVGAGGYALAICSLALLVFSFARRSANRRSIGWLAVTLLLLQASVSPLTFVIPAMRGANALPMLWFAVAVVLACQVLDRVVIWDFPWIAAASVIVLLGKVHWGVLFIAFFATAAVLQSIRRSWRLRLQLMGVVTIAALVPFLAFHSLLSVADSESVTISIRSNLLHGLLAVLLVRFLTILIAIRLAPMPVMSGLLAVLTMACFGYVLLGTSLNLSYLFNGIGVLAALLTPSILSKVLFPGVISSGVASMALAGGALGFTVGLHHLIVVGEYRYGSQFNFGLLEDPVVTSIGLVGLLGVLVVVTMLKTSPQLHRNLSAVAAIASISLSFGVLIALSIKPYVHAISHSRLDLPREILLPEQMAIGEWLQKQPKGDALLASNSLCRVELRIGERIPTSDLSGDCGGRNVNTWLSAVSHRRTLISAPAYGPLAFQVVRNPVHVDAYRASVEFGDKGDEQSLKVLRDFGVDWFVVDIANSVDTVWLSSWAIAFRTEHYAILDLEGSN